MRDENKIYFPDRNIYLMDNHKWAFFIWELALTEGKILKDSTMFHVDAHLDDLPFVLEDYPEYREINNLDELYKFTEEKINYDQFIWPAFGRGTINNIVYVSDFPGDPFEEWSKHYVNGRTYEGVRVRTIEELMIAFENSELEPFVKGKPLILNLDLDYFNEESFWDKPKLKPDREIEKSLIFLRDMYPWDLITVALSPECCGGIDACNHLLQIFLDVFKLDFNKGLSWSK